MKKLRTYIMSMIIFLVCLGVFQSSTHSQEDYDEYYDGELYCITYKVGGYEVEYCFPIGSSYVETTSVEKINYE